MVSIVLVTYNRAERLQLSLQDILNQTFTDFELIICDDCSTDSTEQVCKDFAAKDKRIKYIRHTKNVRMPGNVNFGIQQCAFPYVAILHDGDRFRSDLIEKWYSAISGNASVGFVFNAIGVTDINERLVQAFREFPGGLISKDCLLKKVFFRRWRFDSPVYGEAMVRKELLEKNGYFKAKYGFYADVDFWMEVLHTHDAYFCEETLITGPMKELQPRLFEDNPIHYFIFMFQMQLHHRKKAYRSKPLLLMKELMIFWTQAFLCLNFWLLVIVKNFSFNYFLRIFKLVKGNVVFLLSWVIMLILYPLLQPFFKLYGIVKNFRAKPLAYR